MLNERVITGTGNSVPLTLASSPLQTELKDHAFEIPNLPVVLARIHLGVLHTILLGEQHEGVHWPLAFGGRGVAACS